MPDRRPGGRSARIQLAVRAAVQRLRDDGEELSVPAVARRAGVPPSTVYRRWGGLGGLLAAVAADQLRVEPPADTGSFAGDLLAWAGEYAEELRSPEGRRYLRELVAGSADDDHAGRCGDDTRAVFALLLQRASERDERVVVSPQALVEAVAAPIVYGILFDPGAQPDVAALVRAALTPVAPDP